MTGNSADTFLQEAEELLTRIEEIVLDMNGNSAAADTVNDLFRAFHTIKGSGSMFGFDAVAAFTHHVETSLDKVRDGSLPLSQPLLDLVLLAKDHIKGLLSGETAAEQGAKLILEFSRIAGSPEMAAKPAGKLGASDPQGPQTWRIQFRPPPGMITCGTSPVALLNELRGLGECSIFAYTDRVPDLDTLEPEQCYLRWEIELRSSCGAEAIRDVFIFVEDGSDLQIVLATPALAEADLSGSASATSKKAAGGVSKDSTVRVPAEKLDRLVNLVGELVMNQSRLTQACSRIDAPELSVPVEEIERLVAELRDTVLGIRMMPIGTTFSRFKRLVHDLSAELGKEIDLVTEGADTELDKTVIDQLGDPLIHLIRNSIDHGIEPVEDRLKAGKPGRGTLRLTAEHTGSNVVVSIQDDGHGLSAASIRAKAIDKQLIAADASLSEKEIFNLIFLPGFSTAQKVTSVSGRGVGMDVVKRQIDTLRGSVSIASQAGQGTTISLTLPLTLAIIDGLLVEIGRDQFIVPMAVVTENVEIHRDERTRKNGRNVIAVRGELIPYLHLRDEFGIEGEEPKISKIVIARYEDQRVGLVVDRVLGSHQTVIQSLGRFYRNIELVSGATIMGDGRVALILDLAGLVRFADQLSSLGQALHGQREKQGAGI